MSLPAPDLSSGQKPSNSKLAEKLLCEAEDTLTHFSFGLSKRKAALHRSGIFIIPASFSQRW